MKVVNWMIALTCFLLLVGCASVDVIPEHKATILYFEGGSGRISKNVSSTLINRSRHYFETQGIKIAFLGFNFPNGGRGKYQAARTTGSHFQVIQKKVNDLRKYGHKRLWLMGLSNGAISAMHAGASQIKGVEGLMVINPPSAVLDIQRSPSGFINYRTMRLLVDLNKITLPIMVMIHEKDGNVWPSLTEGFVKQLFSSSKRAEIVMFSGGRIGSTIQATRRSQLYQHGLRGLEEEFAQTVINFIDSNSDITEAGQ